eukprot:TRINITY_DN9239_c0_g1_i1.p1 TRINITY_DN9239_c0_g1~~TRINITY_DN9239_c0_g1_i1.p1  ORF type:complete len:100 (+),score=11.56 TRINITY_DN9239_c0_g1_i1:183-482(+)
MAAQSFPAPEAQTWRKLIQHHINRSRPRTDTACDYKQQHLDHVQQNDNNNIVNTDNTPTSTAASKARQHHGVNSSILSTDVNSSSVSTDNTMTSTAAAA